MVKGHPRPQKRREVILRLESRLHEDVSTKQNIDYDKNEIQICSHTAKAN